MRPGNVGDGAGLHGAGPGEDGSGVESEELAGQVVELLEDEAGRASGLKILSRAGDVVRTDRSRLYVYGHWMGRSDLPSCLLHGEFHITYLICYCPIVLLP